MIAPARTNGSSTPDSGALILGGFALDRRVGHGGMADVWLGRHGVEGHPAAIKVITRLMATDENYREGFRQEVRAVAGLDHPNIVPVYDTGIVDARAAALSDGALVAGSPWLAMQFAEHGELRRLPHPMRWPLLREVLLQILDGLAHAHARGVVHRDLKPENVLLDIESDRLRLMLTDFGIAHVIDAHQTDGGGSTNSAGTPHYMAPEQFRGEWRDYGPWTDLYALGCMAFELATGQPPFTDRNLFGIAHKHLTGTLPPVLTPEPMPAGFESWIGRMMRRDPGDRFQCAADAAWALAQLPVPDAAATRAARLDALSRLGAGQVGAATEVSSPRGVALAETQGYAAAVEPGHTLACVLGPDGGELCLPVRSMPGDAALPAPDTLPPMPQTWLVETAERPLLRGVGLGLFGVRVLPFVGRDAERDILWDALRDVRESGHSRLVVLEGLEGSGKSRLGQWFTRRAAEVGAAEALHVRHSPMDAPGDALAATVDGWFRGQGLERDALERRIIRRLGTLDPDSTRESHRGHASALARFLRPDGDTRLQSHQLTPRERYGAVHGWLHALSRRRPVVLLADDVQWCDDTLSLVEWLMSSACPQPVLIVATARVDQCCEGTPEHDTMSRLRAHPRTTHVPVGPLDAVDLRRVIGDLLGLHPFLADRLLERSGGNPLFAEQIIADWIERTALKPTPQGYTCNGTALVDVPPDLPSLAGRRFDRLAAGFEAPDAVHIALQAAAVLGHAVRTDEWQAVYGALASPIGSSLPEGLQDALFDCGIAMPDRGGWVFGHSFARDALLARARAGDRWSALHRASAEAARGGRAPDERRARHLMLAGDSDAALQALLEVARSRMDASEYSRALSLCDWRVKVLDCMGLPADDVRRAQDLPVRVEALRYLGFLDRAADALQRLRAFPLGPEHPFLLAESERLRGGQAFVRGQVEEMAQAYRQAVDLYRAAGDARGEAKARHGLGWSLLYTGRYAAAERAFTASCAVAGRAGLRLDEAWGLHGIGAARMFRESADGRAPLEAAGLIFHEVYAPVGVLGYRLFLSEVERQAGDLDEALRLAKAAVEIGRTTGAQLMYLARTIVAMLEIDRGRDDRARALLDEMQANGELERIHRQYGPSVKTVRAWLAWRDGDIQRVAELADDVAASRPRTFMHPRSRATLVMLAEQLEAAGETALAARWWSLASAFHVRLGDDRSERFAERARRLA